MAVTARSIIDHFNGKEIIGSGEWLLVSARDIATIDPQISRLCQVVGFGDAEGAKTAIKVWTSKRFKPEGIIIDAATGLKVFKATSHQNGDEVYGSNSLYVSFGLLRPTFSVFDTYLKPDAERVTVSGKRISTSATLEDTAYEYST